MADIIILDEYREPPNPGNGAREGLMAALLEMFPDTDPQTVETTADWTLSELWMRGFKIVPLEPADDIDVGI